MRGAVETVMGEALATFSRHPRDARIVGSVFWRNVRVLLRAARDTVLRKGVGRTHLAEARDCSNKDPASCELYIVEGDSAGGSAKQGRNRDFQAILPLRGKILNVERARLDKMLSNNEIKNLVIALGTSIGETFDLSKLRYARVIIMTDADVDGAHIRTLLLTLFYRYFPELINRGHIYIAQPPLYRVAKGKDVRYAFSDAERDTLIEEMKKIKEEKRKERKGKGAEESVEEGAGEPMEGNEEVQKISV